MLDVAPARGGDLTARDALVELGWSLLDAERVLAEVDPDLSDRRAGAARSAAGGMTQFLAPVLA